MSHQPIHRVSDVSATAMGALAWIGPLLMLLGTAIGSGEVLAEPAAGARYGGTLLWAILFIVLTKAIWNEAVGRVSIVTGQSFLEVCRSAGPLVGWVPWAWYAVNFVKDFFLRGGIAAIAGLICYDAVGPLPLPSSWSSAPVGEVDDTLQSIAWTGVNYVGIWFLLIVGGYSLAEKLSMIFCALLTICLVACAVVALPGATAELTAGLVPSVPSQPGELLMLVSLSGIVMAGSTTIYYSVWAEERQMGLLGHARRIGRRLRHDEIAPQSDEEVRRMRRWLHINSTNVWLTYTLGALICLSTFILGVAVLRPAGVTLKGATLTRDLSLMMTGVAGPWAKSLFSIGAWAAMVSTTIGILDGGSRMFVPPTRQLAPALFAKLSVDAWQKIIMTLMIAGSGFVYIVVPDALELVIWMGAIDAPLVGILIIAYGYLCRRYVPEPYRRGARWTAVMMTTGLLYLAVGTYFAVTRIAEFVGAGSP